VIADLRGKGGLAGSLKLGVVRAGGLTRTLEHGPKVLQRNARTRCVLEAVEVHSWMLAPPS
jgi:hypothetical protein